MRYYGKVGYVQTVEDDPENHPGVYIEKLTEKTYMGDVTKDVRSLESTESLNDDFTIRNTFSIVADDYAYSHFQYIRYIEYLGVKWKVTSVDVSNRPRLIISVRGLYNEGEER